MKKNLMALILIIVIIMSISLVGCKDNSIVELNGTDRLCFYFSSAGCSGLDCAYGSDTGRNIVVYNLDDKRYDYIWCVGYIEYRPDVTCSEGYSLGFAVYHGERMFESEKIRFEVPGCKFSRKWSYSKTSNIVIANVIYDFSEHTSTSLDGEWIDLDNSSGPTAYIDYLFTLDEDYVCNDEDDGIGFLPSLFYGNFIKLRVYTYDKTMPSLEKIRGYIKDRSGIQLDNQITKDTKTITFTNKYINLGQLVNLTQTNNYYN